MKKHVGQVVNSGLCHGCGICQDVCKKHCIQIHHGKSINHPIVNDHDCIECGLCLKVCSGHGIPIVDMQRRIFQSGADVKYDNMVGYWHRCYTGYSTNADVRYHHASGGCLSTFIIYLLRHRIIDGAALVGWKQDDCMTPQPFIARSPKDVISSRGSKYCVVSMEGIVKEIHDRPGKYVVVGLPCHIQSYRKLAAINRQFRDSVVGYFSIYCSSTRTKASQKYLAYKYGVGLKQVKYFAYRDEGCLGKMNYRGEGMKLIKRVPYQHFWQGMRGFFNVPRCSLCIDHYGELADICFGDIHTGEYINDRIGVNSIISRSPYWTQLLQEAARFKWLSLKRIDVAEINASQAYATRQKKGNGVVASFKVRRLLNMAVPKYDINMSDSVSAKDILKDFSKYVMRFMGRHRVFWPLISRLHWNRRIPCAQGVIDCDTLASGDLVMANEQIRTLHTCLQNPRHIWLSNPKILGDTFKAFSDYLEWIIAYCKIENKDRTYDVDVMSQNLFVGFDVTWTLERCKKSLYAIQLYAEELLRCIKAEKVKQYYALIHTVMSDFEGLIVFYEREIKKSYPRLVPTCGSRADIDAREIEETGDSLLFLEQYEKISDLSIRDMRPYCVFNARQLVEYIGKKFIGYSSIVDANGNVIKKFSQVSWEFLSQLSPAMAANITTPVSVNSIKLLNSWSNHFVHSAEIEPIYLQFYALFVAKELNKISTEGVLANGRRNIHFRHGDFRIRNYTAVKAEFELYLRGKQADANVVWLPQNQVQAYIES